MNKLPFVLIATMLPFCAIAQDVKEKSLTRAQQDSVVKKATSTGQNQYVNPSLKTTPRQNASADQYDCDSTCLSMGGNKTYQMAYIENQTARCPAGYKSTSGDNHVITATRKITKKYEGNTLLSTIVGAWERTDNNNLCSKYERETGYCGGGSHSIRERTNYYNGDYIYSSWRTIKDCPELDLTPRENGGGGVSVRFFNSQKEALQWYSGYYRSEAEHYQRVGDERLQKANQERYEQVKEDLRRYYGK